MATSGLKLGLFLLMTAACPFPIRAGDVADPLPSVEVLLAQSRTVYAKASTYVDEGRVLTTFIQPDRTWLDVKPFRTRFVREERFYFVFRSTFDSDGIDAETPFDRFPNQYQIGSDRGVGVWTDWTLRPGVERGGSLMMAIAAATGVSGGSALTVPAQLMPERIGGQALNILRDLKHVELIDQQNAGEVLCWRIEGRRFDDPPLTLWIGVEDKLIHRIDKTKRFDDFVTRTTTHYRPRVGLDPVAIEFPDPPGAE